MSCTWAGWGLGCAARCRPCCARRGAAAHLADGRVVIVVGGAEANHLAQRDAAVLVPVPAGRRRAVAARCVLVRKACQRWRSLPSWPQGWLVKTRWLSALRGMTRQTQEPDPVHGDGLSRTPARHRLALLEDTPKRFAKPGAGAHGGAATLLPACHLSAPKYRTQHPSPTLCWQH